jgi:AraC-like DNA-binding protein
MRPLPASATTGVLHPHESRAHYRLQRMVAPPDLAAHLAHLWIVEWDLGDGPSYTAGVLPFPSVNVTLETARPSRVTGVTTGRYDYEVEGAGRVVGARFRPGGFRPLLDRPVADLTDRVLGVDEVFPGADVGALAEAAVGAPDDAAAVDVILRLLRTRLPIPDPTAELIAHLVDVVAARPDVTRVEQLAERIDATPRHLQRLFREYVGVSPKWVLMRHRLQNATEEMAVGERFDAGRLAARLGYADQAHFTRDFKAVVGLTPGAYGRRLAATRTGD